MASRPSDVSLFCGKRLFTVSMCDVDSSIAVQDRGLVHTLRLRLLYLVQVNRKGERIVFRECVTGFFIFSLFFFQPVAGVCD